MKIAFVVPGFGPSFGSGISLGGLETLSQLSKITSLSIFTPARSEPQYSELLKLAKFYGINIQKVNVKNLLPFFSKNFFRGYPSPASLISLTDLSFLDSMEVVISIEPFSPLSYQLLKHARKKGIKHVVLSWENLTSNPLLNLPPYKFYLDSCKKNSNFLWAATNTTAECFRKKGYETEKIKVSYFGTNTDLYKKEDKQSENNILQILYFGRIEQNKGIHEIVKAFEIVSKKKKNIHLTICGDGISRDWLEERIKKNNAPITYLGFIPENQKPKIFSKADVFISPSKNRRRFGMKVWEEQFGFTFIEAMASGLPVISTSSGSIPEVLGRNNFLIEDVSVEEISKMLEKITSIPKYELVDLGRKNQDRAKNYFDSKKNSRKILEMLRQ